MKLNSKLVEHKSGLESRISFSGIKFGYDRLVFVHTCKVSKPSGVYHATVGIVKAVRLKGFRAAPVDLDLGEGFGTSSLLEESLSGDQAHSEVVEAHVVQKKAREPSTESGESAVHNVTNNSKESWVLLDYCDIKFCLERENSLQSPIAPAVAGKGRGILTKFAIGKA